jgi:hypothetical protein
MLRREMPGESLGFSFQSAVWNNQSAIGELCGSALTMIKFIKEAILVS